MQRFLFTLDANERRALDVLAQRAGLARATWLRQRIREQARAQNIPLTTKQRVYFDAPAREKGHDHSQ